MKWFRMLLAAALCLILCWAMASCEVSGDDEEDVEGVSSQTEERAPTELETLVQDEVFQKQVKALSETYEAKGMRIEVTAEGDSVVYKIIYTVNIDEKKDKQELEEHLESKAFRTSIDSVLRSFKAQVPQTHSVIVRYIDVNGNTIASKEYK